MPRNVHRYSPMLWLVLLVTFVPGSTALQAYNARSIQDVLALYGNAAEQRLMPFFQQASITYPPPRITLLGFKAEKRLELWAWQEQRWVFVRAYAVTAASGLPGPKLRQGDYQVPEGMYTIEAFNPNSHYHLSMKLNYPNPFDRQQAAREGRTQLGGDIFIHGKAVSAGCLAMGDTAIEELFVLAVRLGLEHVSVLIAPHDFRRQETPPPVTLPAWATTLYAEMQRTLAQFRP